MTSTVPCSCHGGPISTSAGSASALGWASKLRTMPYPFAEVAPGASIEIYHGSHAQFETRSPVRTFATYNIVQKQNEEPIPGLGK